MSHKIMMADLRKDAAIEDSRRLMHAVRLYPFGKKEAPEPLYDLISERLRHSTWRMEAPKQSKVIRRAEL